jgi:uncharacterized Fe-S cluster protein YjdI
MSKANTTDFNIQRCQINKYCDNKEISADKHCLANPATKYYPGSACVSDTDCLLGNKDGFKCANNTCGGIANNQNCTNPEECLIGFTCREFNGTKSCLPQLSEGEGCQKETDCKNNLGCYAGNCTKYFSLQTFTNSTSSKLCQSGFILDGKCRSLQNYNNTNCNNDIDCLYVDAGSNSTNVTFIQDSCKCGYSKTGDKICKIGSAEQHYVDYVNSAKLIYNITEGCHTNERDGFCAERTNKNKLVSFRRQQQQFLNNGVIANNANLLAKADQCAKFVFFSQFDDTKIYPDTFVCPKFSCAKNASNTTACLLANNPMTDNGDNITVTINTGICSKNEYCSFGNTGIDAIFKNEKVSGKCLNKSIITPIVTRYPGETCDKNNICYDEPDFKSSCDNSTYTCSGKKSGDNCTSTVQCVSGLYCNGTVCLEQVKSNGKCNETWDCANNLACYNRTCVEFGNVKTGSLMNRDLLGALYDLDYKVTLCEFGKVSSDKCVQRKYDTDKNVTKDTFIQCNWGTKCKYIEGEDKIELPCACGYNDKGQGYCPIAQTTSIINF